MGNTDSVHDVEMNSLSNADNDRPYIKVIVIYQFFWFVIVAYRSSGMIEQVTFFFTSVKKDMHQWCDDFEKYFKVSENKERCC